MSTPASSSTPPTQVPDATSVGTTSELWAELPEPVRKRRKEVLLNTQLENATAESKGDGGTGSNNIAKDDSQKSAAPGWGVPKSSSGSFNTTGYLFPRRNKQDLITYLPTEDCVKVRDDLLSDSYRIVYSKATAEGTLEQLAKKSVKSVTEMHSFANNLLSLFPDDPDLPPDDPLWLVRSHLARNDEGKPLDRRASITAWVTGTLIGRAENMRFTDGTEATIQELSSKLHPDDPMYVPASVPAATATADPPNTATSTGSDTAAGANTTGTDSPAPTQATPEVAKPDTPSG